MIQTSALEAPATASRRSRLDRWLLILILLFLGSVLHKVSMHVVTVEEDVGNSPFAQAAWGLVYVYALFKLARNKARTFALIRQSLPIVIVVGLIALSMLWSSDPSLTAKRAFGLFGTTAIGYYIACTFELADFLEALALATGIAAAVSVALIFGVPRVGVMQYEYAGAWQGIYEHKNILGAAMTLGLVTALAVAIDARGRKRWLYAGLAVLFTLLLGGSRSATSCIITALLVPLLVAGLLLRSKRYARGTAFFLFFGAGTAVVAIASLGFDIQGVFDWLGRDATLTGRTDIWPYVISAISDKPWFGYGYSVFWQPEGPVQQYITTDWLPYHAHNGFLELSLDTGLVGAATFVVGLVLALWRAVVYAGRCAGGAGVWPLVTIVGFILANFTESSIAKYNSIPWVIFLTAFLYVIPALTPQPARGPKSMRSSVLKAVRA